MNENRISIELKAADVAAINEAVGILTAKLQPIIIALEAEEKRNMAKMGEKSVSLVEKATQYAVTNPGVSARFRRCRRDEDGFSSL